ncbi:cupin domain-containing protein [Aestuariibacter sp. GS-14]|nr:cupin domain-containing protein [Aestuariibacter sp. GS-14]
MLFNSPLTGITVTHFDSNEFLGNYWQQKPCVLRQFFPQFEDFIDEHELAGLAMEAELDSRIVRFHKQSWQVIQGPFDDFDQCKGLWSLLIQGVDRVVPDAAEMMEHFNFVPYWRMDDLMISFAIPGAGVGPHVDQYDVFLVQGKGRRRWRVGPPDCTTEHITAPGLRQVDDFTPIIDCELLPGDVLYIPPGWPHDGKAIEPSLTYSVGFRAPEQAQLTGFLAEHFADQASVPLRFSDPKRKNGNTPVWVTSEDSHNLKQLIIQATETQDFLLSLLTLLSEQSLEPESPEATVTDSQTLSDFEQGLMLSRLTGLRPIMHPEAADWLFVNGEKVPHSCSDNAFLAQLLAKNVIGLADFNSHPGKLDIISAFTTLTNMGYYQFICE